MEGVIKKLEDDISEVEAEEREEVRHLVEVSVAPLFWFCRAFSVIFMSLCARFAQTQTTMSCMSSNIAPEPKQLARTAAISEICAPACSAGVQPDGGYGANFSPRSGFLAAGARTFLFVYVGKSQSCMVAATRAEAARLR